MINEISNCIQIEKNNEKQFFVVNYQKNWWSQMFNLFFINKTNRKKKIFNDFILFFFCVEINIFVMFFFDNYNK